MTIQIKNGKNRFRLPLVNDINVIRAIDMPDIEGDWIKLSNDDVYLAIGTTVASGSSGLYATISWDVRPAPDFLAGPGKRKYVGMSGRCSG
jgi:hypothetical protein